MFKKAAAIPEWRKENSGFQRGDSPQRNTGKDLKSQEKVTEEDQNGCQGTIRLYLADHDKNAETTQQSPQNLDKRKQSANVEKKIRKRKRQIHEKASSEFNGSPQQQLARAQAQIKELEYDLVLERRKRRATEKNLGESMDSLAQQLDEAQTQSKNLQFDIDVHESARKQSTGKDLESIIISKRHNERQQNLESETREQLSVFMGLSNKSFRSPSWRDLERDAKQLKCFVKQTIFPDDHPRLMVPAIGRHQSLGRLVVSGLGTEIPLRLETFALRLESLSPQAAVRALVAAAMRNWVFYSNFPNFANAKSATLYTQLKDRNIAIQRRLIPSHIEFEDS